MLFISQSFVIFKKPVCIPFQVARHVLFVFQNGFFGDGCRERHLSSRAKVATDNVKQGFWYATKSCNHSFDRGGLVVVNLIDDEGTGKIDCQYGWLFYDQLVDIVNIYSTFGQYNPQWFIIRRKKRAHCWLHPQQHDVCRVRSANKSEVITIRCVGIDLWFYITGSPVRPLIGFKVNLNTSFQWQ